MAEKAFESFDVKHLLSSTATKNVERGIRDLADGLGEGLLVIQSGRIVFANDRLTDILGWSRGQLMESTSTISVLLDDTIGNTDNPRELEMRRKDDRRVYLRDRSSPIRWGGEAAIVHFLEDITRRKTAEKQLNEQRKVSSILADTVRGILASPLSLQDLASAILDSSISLTGSRRGALIIDDAGTELVLEQRCGGVRSLCGFSTMLDRLENDGKLMSHRRPGRTPGGYYINQTLQFEGGCPRAGSLINLLKVTASNDGSVSAQIVLFDKEETFSPWDLDNMEKVAEVLNLALVRFQAVSELQAAKEAAEAAVEARNLFLANVGHEIRSPLNGVLMMASLLEDTEIDAEQKDLLDVAMSSARSIDRLIRDLSDLTSIRSGKITIHNDEFDVIELCRYSLEICRPDAIRLGLYLELETNPESIRFHGDRERTGQIIANLLSNAVKYTETGGIRLSAEKIGGELEIAVQDTGVGIPPDQQGAVFDTFNQGVFSDLGNAKGMGLGLAVVKNLSEAMGGRVSLSSEIGIGSRFTVVIPETAAGRERNPAVSAGEGTGSEKTPRILVVEDEGVSRLFFRTIIERQDWLVDEAADGIEAISLIRKGEYRIVLMDINMPRMDGLEAISIIREIRPNLPVLAITANDFEDDRQKMMAMGFTDLVRKPVEERELLTRVRSFF